MGILTDRDIVVSAVAQSPDKLESLLVSDVSALDTTLGLPAGATKHQIESAMRQHVIASAEVVGTYRRARR